MQDQNRYEDVPQKENVLVKILKMLGTYLKNLGFDFITSFKYNNMKLAGLLIAVPGAIFGFFLFAHNPVVKSLVYTTVTGELYKNTPMYAGFVLFLLMLFAILNIFTGFTVMNKKNLGSVVLCTITSVCMIACGIVYIYLVATFFQGVGNYFNMVDKCAAANPGLDMDTIKSLVATETNEFYIGNNGIPMQNRVSFNSDYILSVGSVALCMLASIAGCVLGFINYDRTYEKVKR